MRLEEINLGQTEESKKEAIQKSLGQKVILNDWHNGWCHGSLLNKGYDNEVYQMKIEDGRGERRLHYHDLIQLLITEDYTPINHL